MGAGAILDRTYRNTSRPYALALGMTSGYTISPAYKGGLLLELLRLSARRYMPPSPCSTGHPAPTSTAGTYSGIFSPLLSFLHPYANNNRLTGTRKARYTISSTSRPCENQPHKRTPWCSECQRDSRISRTYSFPRPHIYTTLSRKKTCPKKKNLFLYQFDLLWFAFLTGPTQQTKWKAENPPPVPTPRHA